MDRNAFGTFCLLLKNLGDLVDGKHVSVEEQVVMFLSILAHHEKNRVIKFSFMRFGETVTRYVHLVLKSILKEQVLMCALKDLVPHGWKSDNGFHTGYIVRCENAMKVSFSNTDLLAVPHITSKIISWKKSYGNILIAQSSGVGFNTTTGELDCIDEQ
ncbi:hypothetical protein ACS0TY_011050 [Phlomoides rotata]